MKLFFSYLISLNRKSKQFILAVIDILILVVSIFVSLSLQQEKIYWPTNAIENRIVWLILVTPLIALPLFSYFGLYREIIRYLGISAGLAVLKAVLLYSLIWILLVVFSGTNEISNSVLLINFLITLVNVGGSRAIMKYILWKNQETSQKNKNNFSRRVLIFGAGEAGRQLAYGLTQSFEYELHGFVDDKKELQGREMMGFPIISVDNLSEYIKYNNITDLLLAVPSISRKERYNIIKKLHSLPLRIRTLPGLVDLIQGQDYLSNLQELDIDDLLLRQKTAPHEDLLIKQVHEKIIFVTGAGGSIGSEICLQVLKRFPKKLILLELNEYALYNIHQELISFIKKFEKVDKFSKTELIPILGSAQDEKRLTNIFKSWKPDVIYHTAAYKHVPIVEHNIAEGIKNNVFGTFIVAKIAIEYEVSNFILISTDKAVNPTNIMGASKRIAEMTIQSIAQEKKIFINFIKHRSSHLINKTNFSIVRFGNVLNSSGSVIPLFRKQIQNGGPITITDKKVERYFMTISEAAQLVIQSGAMSHKNIAEVFVLDMGKSVKIFDLACRMINMYGLRIKDESNPDGDISIEIIGLRSGEKLYEELLIGNNPQPTQHTKILKANEEFIIWNKFQIKLQTLKMALDNNDLNSIFDILKDLVKGYKRKDKNVEFSE